MSIEFENNTTPFGLLGETDQEKMRWMWESGNYEFSYWTTSGWAVKSNDIVSPNWTPTVVYRFKKKKKKKTETHEVSLIRNKRTGLVLARTSSYDALEKSKYYEVLDTVDVTFEWYE